MNQAVPSPADVQKKKKKKRDTGSFTGKGGGLREEDLDDIENMTAE